MNNIKLIQSRRIALRQEAHGSDEVMVNINTTPLIDVMLVLLVMLIITIPLETQSVKLSLGRNDIPDTSNPPPSLIVDIDFDNSIAFDKQSVPNEEALQKHFQDIVALPTQPTIFIRPNRLVKYKIVAEILADAQRIGIKKIGIMNQD